MTDFNPNPSGGVTRKTPTGATAAGPGGSDWTLSSPTLVPTAFPNAVVFNGTGNVTASFANPNAYSTDPVILQAKLGSTPVFNVYGDGSAYFGGQTIAHFGPPRTQFGIMSPLVAYLDTDTDPAANTAIQAYFVLHNTAVDGIYDFAVQQGGSAYNRLQIAGANGYVGQVNFNVAFNDSASIDINSGNGAQGGAYKWLISGFEGVPLLQMRGGANIAGLATLVQFDPSGTFGTPFSFKTSAAIGSGDVFTVTNNATLGFGVNFEGKVRTAAPSVNGAGAIRIGKIRSATVAAVTTEYLEIEIDGVIKKVQLCS
jgi:hypothetical protein